MQTIKTAVVVVLLLGVCYGAYVALNAPEPTLPPELAEWNEGDLNMSVQTGNVIDLPELSSASSSPPDLQPLSPPALVPPALVPPPALSGQPGTNVGSTPSAPPEIELPTFPLDLTDKSQPESLSSKLSPNSAEQFQEGQSIALPSELTAASLSAPKEVSQPTAVAGADNVVPPSFGLPDTFGLPPLPSSNSNENPIAINAPPASPDLPGTTSQADSGTSTSSLTNTLGTPNPLSTSSAPGSASAMEPKANRTLVPYQTAHQQAMELANAGKLKEALALMSPYFDHISLLKEEHDDLRALLDALAGEVIYSQRHLLESQFVVSPGESLESIANKFRISPEALANINRLGNSRVVLPGTVLKVVRGPFRAEVDLSRSELVLYLGDLYAGIFPVTIGNEPKPELGSFTIIEKLRDKSYSTIAGFIPHSDPRNPYGGYWMHLGKDICIHGSAEASDPRLANAGCISLAPLDARDVYALLGQGSEVTIKE